jgi:hypothetical protein
LQELRELRQRPGETMDRRDRKRVAAAARKARSGNRPFTIPNECANRIHANWRVKRAAHGPAHSSLAFA